MSQLGAAAASWNGPQHSWLQTCSVVAWRQKLCLGSYNQEHAVEPKAAGFVSFASITSLLQLQAWYKHSACSWHDCCSFSRSWSKLTLEVSTLVWTGQGDISTQLGIINGRKTLLTTIWLNFTWSFSAKCNQCIHIWLKFDLPSENQHWNASPKWDSLKVGIPPNDHDHGKMIIKLSINIFSGAQRKKRVIQHTNMTSSVGQ